ncbi:hypothetical protein AAG570_011908 [Ranatra chinensis]|uniref:Dihydrolipoamide acetyltransferase component of pyruvate dehydrogenase complex n=1 Tax=Ranatra chinensis TaxID=642074 RepID=A0ABD0YHA1_9HEMI
MRLYSCLLTKPSVFKCLSYRGVRVLFGQQGIQKLVRGPVITDRFDGVLSVRFSRIFQHLRWFKLGSWHYSDIIVKVPPFPESVNEGDIRWDKKEGDGVLKDEVVCEIETDKTAIPVPSPVAGTISALMVPESSTVKSGQEIFKVMPGVVKPTPQAPPSKSKPTPSLSPAQSKSISPPMPPGSRTENRVKMTALRKTTAKRLKDSQNTFAMLTTFNEIDMSALIEFRRLNQKAFKEKYGVKLGFMSAFLKSSAYALLNQPVVNAVIDGDAIVYRNYVDISVAVASPKVVIRPMMYVALTYDHRLVDGREAVTFLRKIKESVEDPKIILFGL